MKKMCKEMIPDYTGFHRYNCKRPLLPDADTCAIHTATAKAEREKERNRRGRERFERQMAPHRVAERLRKENDAFRAALEPFVKFIDAWDGQPLRNFADDFYSIHTGTEWEASLRLSDFRAAREALAAVAKEK